MWWDNCGIMILAAVGMTAVIAGEYEKTRKNGPSAVYELVFSWRM
jgi:hypothetical protein